MEVRVRVSEEEVKIIHEIISEIKREEMEKEGRDRGVEKPKRQKKT